MTPAQIEVALPNAPIPWLIELCASAVAASLTTPARQACFTAQVAHESAQFTHLQESLNYSDPVRIAKIFKSPFDLDHDGITVEPEEVEFARGFVHNSVKLANYAYANRLGNGPVESGDGYRFRGRGPIQITGRQNYVKCGMAIAHDIVASPDLLLEPQSGLASAFWFWRTNGCNELADKLDHVGLTKRINGGTTGLDDRIRYFDKIYKEIS